MQQVLSPSWRHTKLQRQKDSFPTNGLITPTKCRIQNFPLMMPSTANFVAATLSKPNTQTMLIYWKVDWPQTEQTVIKMKLSKPPPTGIENFHYLQQIWKQEQMSSFKDFLRWYNNKHVLPTLEAMQKMTASYHDKDIQMLKLGCTLPNLANICLHKSTEAKIYPFIEGDKDLLKKMRKTMLGAHLSFLHTKQLLIKLLSESLPTYANLLLELLPANYARTRCAKPCPRVSIRVEISIQKPVDSHLDKTRPVASKIWSCLIFNVQDLIVKLRASTLQADRKKIFASVFMCFVLIAILCLKQCVAFTTFVPVKSCAHLSLTKISNVAVGEENSMKWDEAIYRRKFSLSLKCGNVSVGDFTRQTLMLNYISERISLTDDHLQNNNS